MFYFVFRECWADVARDYCANSSHSVARQTRRAFFGFVHTTSDINSLYALPQEIVDTVAVFSRVATTTDPDVSLGPNVVYAGQTEIARQQAINNVLHKSVRAELQTELSDALQETFEQLDDLRTPDPLDHCSFRHYSIFISDHWATVEERFDHNPDFIRELINRVGEIRNQLFHFRDGDTAPDLDSDFLEFAREHFQYVQSQSPTRTTRNE